MMGHSHAVTGAAAWLAITVPGAGTGLIELDTPAILSGTLITAGAALLPDADHHSGTIAWSLPPVSKHITAWVGRISGGHRHATHSLFGVLIAFALAWALTPWKIPLPTIAGPQLDDFQIGAFVIAVLMIAFALKSLRLTRRWFDSWASSLALAAIAVYHAPDNMWWLPTSIALGCFIHIVGDMLTIQGVPWLWPFHPRPRIETAFWKRNGYFAIPILGTAGSIREWVFITALYGYLAYGIAETISPGTITTITQAFTNN